jgi:hypothetical protein
VEQGRSDEPFAVAREAAAAWRGKCIEIFARSETAITEALLVLAGADEANAPKLPHLVGQRYEALLRAVDHEGPFPRERMNARAAVAAFRTNDALRTFLTHGSFTVTLDQRGRWHLVIRVVALCSGRVARDLFATDEEEAADTLRTLLRDGNRLGSALGQLRQRIASAQGRR